MIVYFCPIVLCFLSWAIPKLRNSQLWYKFVLIYLCLFLCFGYMCGSDWRYYEPLYEELDPLDIYSTYKLEPGYGLWMGIFKLFGFGFWPFFIVTKIVAFAIFSKFVTKLSGKYCYLVWAYFLPSFGYYLFVDNPMRNLLAISIFLLSLQYIYQRSLKKYLLFTLIAFSFHITAIITIPLYFILNRSISTKVWVITLLCFWLIFVDPNIISILISNFTGVSPYIANKITLYFVDGAEEGGGSGVFTWGAIPSLVFCFLILFFRNKIEKQPNGLFVLNGSLIFLLFYRLGLTVSIFFRLQLFVAVLYSVSIGFLIESFVKSSRKLYIVYIFLLSSLIASKLVYIPKYVPYTSYLPYMLSGNFPSYEYRFDYNYEHTLYPENVK